MMDSREYFYAMYEKRTLLRAQSRETYEQLRFKEFLERQTNPWLKKTPQEYKDVIQFTWELEKKMTVQEMKEAFKAIVGSYKPPKIRKLRTDPPKHLQDKTQAQVEVQAQKKMRRTK